MNTNNSILGVQEESINDITIDEEGKVWLKSECCSW